MGNSGYAAPCNCGAARNYISSIGEDALQVGRGLFDRYSDVGEGRAPRVR
jgi:hypothetical protein